MNRTKKILILFLVAITVHIALSLGYKKVMSESQLMKSDREMLKIPSNNFNLIVGNSHALAVQTDLWKNSFSIASYGEEIHQSYFKIKHVIEVNDSEPDTILLSFDLGMMHQVILKDQAHQWYWNKYESSSELAPFAHDKFEFYSHRIQAACFPYMDGEVEVYDYFFSKKDSLAMMRRETKIQKLGNPQGTRQLSDSCLNAQFSPIGVHYFQSLLQLCKEHSIVLVLVQFPVTPHHYWSQSLCFEPTEYYNQCHSILDEGGLNYKVIDFHNRYDEGYFRDPHHLKGGDIRTNFTLELLKEMQLSN